MQLIKKINLLLDLIAYRMDNDHYNSQWYEDTKK
jgi:hypothetical protein